MYFQPLQRYLPRSPLPKTPAGMRAELTHLAAELLKLEREQQVQLQRIAQIQQELDDIKRLLKRIASK